MSSIRFSTALREHARETIEALRQADLVVGIPCYQSQATLPHVIQTVARGLEIHYPDTKALIMISDGGSTDDAREVARRTEVNSFHIEKLVTIYRGIPGKGSGLRAVFEAANFLKAKAVAVYDSDLKSITPAWVRNLMQPVLDGYDLVTPYYRRYKLDGTITNTVAYNLTSALFGAAIRQPIGGDFGLSPALVKHFLDQDVWETDVAKFGIDIYMTTTAVVRGFRICQARLGQKIHGHKDPSADLGPMFRQVVGTIFALMGAYEDYWRAAACCREVPILGDEVFEDPAPFEIDREGLVEYFRLGFGNFEGIWERLLEEQDMAAYRRLVKSEGDGPFRLPLETWVRTVYRYAAAYQVSPRQRMKIVDTLIPLYYARVASLIDEIRGLNAEEAESYFEEGARIFARMKGYLTSMWMKGA